MAVRGIEAIDTEPPLGVGEFCVKSEETVGSKAGAVPEASVTPPAMDPDGVRSSRPATAIMMDDPTRCLLIRPAPVQM
jgi:hypothetical protein